jgi:hypothetical protein
MSGINHLIEKCRKHVQCDSARIVSLSGTMFFIIGFHKSTKDDIHSQWVNHNNIMDFTYTEEHTIASGKTEKELLESVQKYVQLSSMSWEDYFSKYVIS